MSFEPRPEGKLLVLHDGDKLPPEFERELRAHKAELLAWLSAGHLIKQVQCGEFDTADRATVENIVGVLKTSGHPLARPALERLFLGDDPRAKTERRK